MHFADDEYWSDTLPAIGIDLVTVAAHEIGHALGLDHAPAEECSHATTGDVALMCAFYSGPQRFLGSDDVAGIQALYGTPPVCADELGDPDFATFDSILCNRDVIQERLETSGFPIASHLRLESRIKRVGRRITYAQRACQGNREARAHRKL